MNTWVKGALAGVVLLVGAVLLFAFVFGARQPGTVATVSPTATPEPSAEPMVADARAEPGATPFYFTRAVGKADVEGRSLRELNLMRNTIYARAGNPFRKRWLHEFFTAQDWYQPKAAMDESKLSALDRKNAETIAAYEVSLTRDELARRRTDILERIQWADQTRIETVAISRDGKMIASGGAAVELWDVATGARTKVLEPRDETWPNDGIALSFSDDGSQLAVVQKSGAVVVHHLAAGTSKEVVAESSTHFFTDDSVYEDRASFARGPWRVAVAVLRKEEEPAVSVHELPSGKLVGKVESLADGEVRFTADGRLLVRKGEAVVVADPAAAKKTVTLALGSEVVEQAVASPDGKNVLAWMIGDEAAWLLWQPLDASAPGTRIPLTGDDVTASEHLAGRAPAPIAFLGPDSVIFRFGRRSLPSGAVQWALDDVDGTSHLAVSEDGRRVVVADEEEEGSRIDVLDAATGKPLPSWRGHEKASPETLLELQLLSRSIGMDIPAIALEGMAAEEVRTPLDDVSQLDRHLEVKELADLSRRDLRLLRNAIYARRGRPFKSEIIRYHFERMSWYTADPKFTDARLTAVDLHNIKIVQSVEATVGGPLTDAGHEEEIISEEYGVGGPSFEGQRWFSGA